jgi:hypothetical protein
MNVHRGSEVIKLMASKLTIIVVLLIGVAYAHPFTRGEVNPPPVGYTQGIFGFYPEDSYGQIEFYALPDASSLSLTERYIVNGLKISPDDVLAQPWWLSVTMYARAHYDKYGKLPGVLEDAAIAKALGKPVGSLPSSTKLALKNPFNDLPPRLDAIDMSTGDLFMRPLTPAEMRHLASRKPHLMDYWFNGIKHLENGGVQKVKAGTPFYVRIYGEGRVILSTVIFKIETL